MVLDNSNITHGGLKDNQKESEYFALQLHKNVFDIWYHPEKYVLCNNGLICLSCGIKSHLVDC